jgi:LysM repeat protein
MRRNNIASPDFIVSGRTLIVPAPGKTPAPLPSERTPAPAPRPARQGQKPDEAGGGEIFHRIEPGENLSTIAARYKIDPGELMRRNNIASPDFIVSGRTLIIPAPGKTPAPPKP